MKAYNKRWCYVCGRSLSTAGAAWVSHCRKHVREGKMIERKVYDRRERGHSYLVGWNYHYEFDVAPGVQIVINRREGNGQDED